MDSGRKRDNRLIRNKLRLPSTESNEIFSTSSASVLMSTTVITDAMVMPATAKLITDTAEVKSVKCDCCGLTEDCTPEYIERIRERYQGNWICGLCGEAVKDEVVRSERLITTDEAMARHVSFCRAPISSGPPTDPTVHLIAAMRQILRRSLDSPASVRSVPCSPTTKVSDGSVLARSESCIPDITLVDSFSCDESEEDGEGSKDIGEMHS